MRIWAWGCGVLFFSGMLVRAEKTPGMAREFLVVTYNVENLFDLDRVAKFDDYVEVPDDPNSYGPAKLLGKLRGIGKVLQSVDGGKGPEGGEELGIAGAHRLLLEKPGGGLGQGPEKSTAEGGGEGGADHGIGGIAAVLQFGNQIAQRDAHGDAAEGEAVGNDEMVKIDAGGDEESSGQQPVG